MRLYADAIVTNQFNQALFVRRNDSRTWAPPGGALEAGELPTEAIKREVEEETGLKVMPVRLVGLYFRPEKPGGLLVFVFRCIQRGGHIRPSPESPQVAFMNAVPLPRPMLGIHREMFSRALAHGGGPPYWGYQPMPFGVRLLRDVLYKGYDLWRALRRRPAFAPPPPWQTGAFVVLPDDQGRALWLRRRDFDVWNLPGGASEGLEAPWEVATREAREETGLTVRLTDLSGVYVKPATNEILFTFLGQSVQAPLQTTAEAAEFGYFAPGQEPANALPKQLQRAADALDPSQTTHFRLQSGPPGLELLGVANTQPEN